MNRTGVKLLLFVFFTLLSSKPVFAYNPYATGSAVVSATVVGTSFSPPILISPGNNAVTSNTRESLVWQRPNPLPVTPLHHYDVYLDGQMFASSVSDSISSQTYYFYTIRRDGNTFYLEMTSDITQGYHTWSVIAFNSVGVSASSETRTFYVDSVTPFIKLEKVDHQTLNWNTADVSTIPDINLRDLEVTTPDPLLTGSIEPYANMQIILICPQNILNCTNQSYTGNYPSGTWQHRFYGLKTGLVYTVYLSATDAAGNSVIFPEFYLAYGIKTPFFPATITPEPSISPTVFPSITPEITPEIEVPPIPFIPVPPAAPTPPPVDGTLVLPATDLFSSYWYLILLAIGLPLHLIMTIYGTKTRVSLFFNFLISLLFPFIGKKEYQTVPFSTIEMYDPDKLDSPWQRKISDVRGFYHLSSPILSKIFVKIASTGRTWKRIIIDSSILPTTCLIPLLEDTQMASSRLQILSMRFRSLPLIIACLSSGILLIIYPNNFLLIYLYLSLQLAFSEYLYPKLSK